jgi:hypothetical protein
MALALSIFGVAFAAFCIWLTVRIVNRRERWAKWTLATVVGLPVLYLASFGPACWWFAQPSTDALGSGTIFNFAPGILWPIGSLAKNGPRAARVFISWYGTIGIEQIIVPIDSTGLQHAGLRRS